RRSDQGHSLRSSKRGIDRRSVADDRGVDFRSSGSGEGSSADARWRRRNGRILRFVADHLSKRAATRPPFFLLSIKFVCGKIDYWDLSVTSGLRESTSAVARVPTNVTNNTVAPTPPKFTTGVKFHGISKIHFDVAYDNPTAPKEPIKPATNPIS